MQKLVPTMPTPVPVRVPSGPLPLNAPATPSRIPSAPLPTTPNNPTPLGPAVRRLPSGPRGDAPLPTPPPTRSPGRGN